MSEINIFGNHLCEQLNNCNKKPSTLIFKKSDYDLDWCERIAKFRNYDRILCEKCNQKLDYYCKDCYEDETDNEERERMLYGKCKECLRIKRNNKWCLHHFQQDFDKWTSGNKDIDELIQDIQLSADENI